MIRRELLLRSKRNCVRIYLYTIAYTQQSKLTLKAMNIKNVSRPHTNWKLVGDRTIVLKHFRFSFRSMRSTQDKNFRLTLNLEIFFFNSLKSCTHLMTLFFFFIYWNISKSSRWIVQKLVKSLKKTLEFSRFSWERKIYFLFKHCNF